MSTTSCSLVEARRCRGRGRGRRPQTSAQPIRVPDVILGVLCVPDRRGHSSRSTSPYRQRSRLTDRPPSHGNCIRFALKPRHHRNDRPPVMAPSSQGIEPVHYPERFRVNADSAGWGVVDARSL